VTAESFLRPEAAPVLLLAPLAGIALHLLARRRSRRLERLAAGRHRAQRPGWFAARPVLAAGGLLLAGLAFLEPVWGEGEGAAVPRASDVVLCLDVSRSMLAGDLPGGRLEAARREIRALAERAQGDRLALVAFAGEARVVVPLTRDAATFSRLLDGVDPATVARGGTDLAAALESGLAALRGAGRSGGTIVLVTDGEDHEGRGARAARTCRDAGVVVHCVGVGSADGAKIVVGDAFLRDRSGREVVSSLDAASLRKIAEAADGAFVEARGEEHSLVALYESRILPAARSALAEERRRDRIPRFQAPLAGALVLWSLHLALSSRRAS
jgi:Ca-activated chloride channel homolog